MPHDDLLEDRQQDGDTPSYAAPLIGFRSRKAAQLAAYFAIQNQQGMVDKLKLIKLIYLTEREYLSRHQRPILFDEFYSLPHGPVCSSTLNGIDGVIHEAVWGEFTRKHGNRVVAIRRFQRDDLDELSDAALSVADEIWRRFGHMTSSQIRNWSHRHCSEYTDVERGRLPISYGDVLSALGDPEARSIDQEIREYRLAESALRG